MSDKNEVQKGSPGKLLSGEVIPASAFEHAKRQLRAYFLFAGLKYDAHRLECGTMEIPIRELLKKRPATQGMLDACAKRLANKDLAAGRVPELDSKKDLRPAERFEAMQSPEAFKKVCLTRHKEKLLAELKCLPKSKKPWTLLDISQLPSLRSRILHSLGQADLDFLKRTGTLHSYGVVMLLARKNLRAKTQTTNAIKAATTEKRKANARKGWAKIKGENAAANEPGKTTLGPTETSP